MTMRLVFRRQQLSFEFVARIQRWTLCPSSSLATTQVLVVAQVHEERGAISKQFQAPQFPSESLPYEYQMQQHQQLGRFACQQIYG